MESMFCFTGLRVASPLNSNPGVHQLSTSQADNFSFCVESSNYLPKT